MTTPTESGPPGGTGPVDDLVAGLRRAAESGSPTVDELRESLSEAAAAEGVLELAWRPVDSPHGPLLVASSDRGVVRVAFEVEGHDRVLDDLAARVGPRILRSSRRTEDAARQLGEYFEGQRRDFDLALDLRLVHGFRREVVESLGGIPYGSTASYAELARRAGRPAAVRAVGSACANNPVPILLPCHRIVRSDGTIGSYLGGAEVKAALLELESSLS